MDSIARRFPPMPSSPRRRSPTPAPRLRRFRPPLLGHRPIDGTRNYVRKFPLFAVSSACWSMARRRRLDYAPCSSSSFPPRAAGGRGSTTPACTAPTPPPAPARSSSACPRARGTAPPRRPQVDRPHGPALDRLDRPQPGLVAAGRLDACSATVQAVGHRRRRHHRSEAGGRITDPPRRPHFPMDLPAYQGTPTRSWPPPRTCTTDCWPSCRRPGPLKPGCPPSLNRQGRGYTNWIPATRGPFPGSAGPILSTRRKE